MNTLFISDLHLEDGRPETTAMLTAFLRGPARQADAVYVLGDLFEFWIGDDVLSETARSVARDFAELRQHQTPCFFLHGNRDFLLGHKYAQQAGLRLLPETCVVDLYGNPTLLLHGDTLCTDDVGYQAFRRQVRSPQFAQTFLQLPAEKRLQTAQNARDASMQHTGEMSRDIMDVNESAVRNTFSEYGVTRMIHGHTHRCAVHRYALDDGKSAKRIVLADWSAEGSYLIVDPKHEKLVTLHI